MHHQVISPEVGGGISADALWDLIGKYSTIIGYVGMISVGDGGGVSSD